VIGRESDGGGALLDERISRRHAEILFDGKSWTIRDFGSRNGTFVDGVRVDGALSAPAPRVLRVGQTILLFERDVGPYIDVGMEAPEYGNIVAGPALRRVLQTLSRTAQAQSVENAATIRSALLIGESGTGKELAARTFHAAARNRSRPFVAVNCATIPESLAERLLFGARRGAYTGASADAEGYFKSANGGTLFLDEIGELDLAVQAKLLRVLETREVTPLGALRAERVDVCICSATHRDLRKDVKSGLFRADLFYRLARPTICLPPLRERLEEIPWLVAKVLEGTHLLPDARFVESCLLRCWPGNVRELLAELSRVRDDAVAAGASVLHQHMLGPTAGAQADEPRAARLSSPPAAPLASPTAALTREDVERALDEANGNLSAAARVLQMHRTQLRRLVKRFGITVK
jgi:transcriptional regulator with GAF, ATPase, and Fis domain